MENKSEVLIDLEKWSVVISDFDLIGKDLSWGFYDIMFAMMCAYSLISFMPTLAVNSVILIKEAFMN